MKKRYKKRILISAGVISYATLVTLFPATTITVTTFAVPGLLMSKDLEDYGDYKHRTDGITTQKDDVKKLKYKR